MASVGLLPWRRSASSAKSIIMIAFFLTMPISRMMPIRPHHVQLHAAQQQGQQRAPTPAEGSVDRIVTG